MVKESGILDNQLCFVQLKLKYTFFLLQLMKNWANNDCETEEEDVVEIEQTGTSTCTRRYPHRDPPERLSGNMWQRILEQIVGTGK